MTRHVKDITLQNKQSGFTNVYFFCGHYSVILQAHFDTDRHSYNRQERWRIADLIPLIGPRLSFFYYSASPVLSTRLHSSESSLSRFMLRLTFDNA